MKNFLIYDNNSEQVVARIQAESAQAICNPYSSIQYQRIEVPVEIALDVAGLDENLAVIEDAGLVASKLQAEREAKLSLMRSMRDEKLKEVDIMINELALAERSDSAAIAAYRTALKEITDDYKDGNGDADSTCDALEADLSDLTWPTAP